MAYPYLAIISKLLFGYGRYGVLLITHIHAYGNLVEASIYTSVRSLPQLCRTLSTYWCLPQRYSDSEYCSRSRIKEELLQSIFISAGIVKRAMNFSEEHL
jgi:hypothetical protein